MYEGRGGGGLQPSPSHGVGIHISCMALQARFFLPLSCAGEMHAPLTLASDSPAAMMSRHHRPALRADNPRAEARRAQSALSVAQAQSQDGALAQNSRSKPIRSTTHALCPTPRRSVVILGAARRQELPATRRKARAPRHGGEECCARRRAWRQEERNRVLRARVAVRPCEWYIFWHKLLYSES